MLYCQEGKKMHLFASILWSSAAVDSFVLLG